MRDWVLTSVHADEQDTVTVQGERPDLPMMEMELCIVEELRAPCLVIPKNRGVADLE